MGWDSRVLLGRIIAAMAPKCFFIHAPAPVAVALTAALLGGCDAPAPPVNAPPASLSKSDPMVQQAIEAATDAATEAPDSAATRMQLALLLDANGFESAATQVWMNTRQLSPSDARPDYFMALQAADDDRLTDAIAAMARARALDDSHAPTHWREGYWLLDLGQPEAAKVCFQRAKELDATAAAAWVGMARADMELDNHDAAIAQLQQLVSRSGHPYTLYLLGQALRRAGRGAEAASLPVGTSAAVPRFPDIWYESILDATRGHDAEIDRIDRYLEDGRIDDAQRAAQEGLKVWADDIHLLNRLGEVHRRRNDAAGWVRTLQRAVRIDPESFQSHLNLSMARRAAGDHDRALQSAIAAVALRGDLPDGHLQVARMHLLGRRPEEAIKALDAAFALGVTDPVERLQFAATLMAVGRFEESITIARDLAQANPRSPGAWHVLASAYRGADQLRLAFDAALAGSRANDNNQQLAALAADIQAQARQAAQVDP